MHVSRSTISACRSPSDWRPPSIATFFGIGYGPLSDSEAYWNATRDFACVPRTTVIGIPIGPPSQSPEPKSACMWSSAPIAADDPIRFRRDRQLVDPLVPRARGREDRAGGRLRQLGGRGDGDAECEHADGEERDSRHRRGDAAEAGVLSSGSVTSGYSARISSTNRASRSAIFGVADLEHVLRVHLARVREVEAADERDVVGDRDLGVHEVVHGVRRPLGRRLAGEPGDLEEAAKRRHLPARVPVQVPLVEDAVDLRVVDDAADVDLSVGADLGQRPEDRPRAEHGRGDPDPPLRLADPLRDPVRERLAVLGREPGPHLDPVHVDRPRLDVTRADHVAGLPELVEVEAVGVRELGRLDDRDHVLLPRPRVLRPVHRAGPDRLAVADRVLVVHQVGDAGNRPRLDRQRFEQLGRRLRRRRHRDRPGVVDVVDEPDDDAALLRVDQRRGDELGRLVVQADVVERELQRLLCGARETRPPRVRRRRRTGRRRGTSGGRSRLWRRAGRP